MSIAKRVADEMDGESVGCVICIRFNQAYLTATRETSWLFDPFRRHDRTGHDIFAIHDGRYAST